MSTPVAEKKSLASKLAEVMGELHRIPKTGRNEFHHYDYATEADIVEAVRGELAKRHVIVLPAVTKQTREPVGEKGQVLTTLDMEFEFLDGESGERIVKPWIGAGTDKEDKGVYKAMTGAVKFFLLKTFLLPTGDDPEQDQAEAKPQKARRAPAPPADSRGIISDAQRKRLYAISKEAGWQDQDVKDLLKHYNIASSKDVPVSLYDEICKALQSGEVTQ